jgi:hypothetical protein
MRTPVPEVFMTDCPVDSPRGQVKNRTILVQGIALTVVICLKLFDERIHSFATRDPGIAQEVTAQEDPGMEGCQA